MSFETRFTVSLNITFESMLDEPRPDATLLDVHPEVPGVYRTVKGALLLSPSPPAIAPSQLRLVE